MKQKLSLFCLLFAYCFNSFLHSQSLDRLPPNLALFESDKLPTASYELPDNDNFGIQCKVLGINNVSVKIIGGDPPFDVYIEDVDPSSILFSGIYEFTAYNLPCGNHEIVVADGTGTMQTCSVTIESNSIYNIESCPGGIVALEIPTCNIDLPCYRWQPEELFSNVDIDQPISMPFYENQVIELIITDGLGNIINELTYNITINAVDSDNDGICDPDDPNPNNGCSPNPNLPVFILGETTACGNTTLSASSGDYYFWSNGATSNQINVTSSGVYSVTASDADGCSGESSVLVTILPDFDLTISGDPILCQNQTTTLTAIGGETYSWNVHGSGPSITVSSSGIYSVTASNSHGCTNTSTFFVLAGNGTDNDNDNVCSGTDPDDGEPCEPSIDLLVTGETEICRDAQTFLNLNINNGVPPYDITWTVGNTDGVEIFEDVLSVFTPPNATLWVISVTDANGCLQEAYGAINVSDFSDTDGDQVCDDVDCDIQNYSVTVDSDGDGVCDEYDCAPNDPLISLDTDGDGICDEDDCEAADPAVGVGIACNDGDVCTEGDKYDLNCDCVGTLIVSCVSCEENSPCDDNNPCTADDRFDEECNCRGIVISGCVPCEEDAPCDDNNDCTFDDQFNEDCFCEGVILPNCQPCITNGCDDGDPCTINDHYDDLCNCNGTQINEFNVVVNRYQDCSENIYVLHVNEIFESYSWQINGVEVGREQTFTAHSPGVYSIRVEGNGDCELTKEVNVFHNVLPNNHLITADKEAICEINEVVNLEIPPTFTNTSWFDEGGQLISNANVVSVTEAGVFTVETTNTLGCELKGQKEISYQIGNIEILPEYPMICDPGTPLTLSLTNISDNIQEIEWSTGASTESIDVTTSGTYAVTIIDANHCVSVDEIAVIGNNETDISQVLLDNGFEAIEIEILDITTLQNPDDNRSSRGSCDIDISQTNANYQIRILSTGEMLLARQYLQNCLDPYCIDDLDIGGILQDHFCDDPNMDLEKLIEFNQQFEDGGISGFIFATQDIGAAILFVKKNLKEQSCVQNLPYAPFIFKKVLNEILCAKSPKNGNPQNLYLLGSIDKSILSGPVKLFDQKLYENNVFPPTIVIENFRVTKVLNTSDPSSFQYITFTDWCSIDSYYSPIARDFLTKVKEHTGQFLRIIIPYTDGDEKLTITLRQDNAEDFLQLWNNPDGVAAVAIDEARVNHDFELLESIPTCFIDDIDLCEILTEDLADPQPLQRNDAENAIKQLLDSRDQHQSEVIINCMNQNALVYPYVNKIFRTNRKRVSLFGRAIRTYQYSQLAFSSQDESDRHFRLDEDPAFTLISSFDPHHLSGSLKITTSRGITGDGDYYPFQSEDWAFDYFKNYPVKIGAAFKYLTIDPDNEDEKILTRVPGLYLAYATENRILRMKERQEEFTIALAGTFLGFGELQFALKATRWRKARALFAIGETTINAASIFLESETFCQYLNAPDFCNQFNALKPNLELVLLTGYFSISLVDEFINFKHTYDNILSPAQKSTLESNMGTFKFQAFDALLDNLPDLKMALKVEFDKIKVYADGDGFDDLFDQIADHEELKEKATTLLGLKEEILLLDEASQPSINGYQLMKDILNSASESGKIGYHLEELTEGRVKAWGAAHFQNDAIKLERGFLENLGNHLDDFPNLKLDLEDNEVFNAYKKISDDVEQSYEILDDVEGNLTILIAQKTANSNAPNFWKWIQKGRDFENYLLPNFKNRTSSEYLQLKFKAASEFYVDLNGYDMYKQVQLKYNGSDYFVADHVYVKWVDLNGTKVIDDIVIVENKLKESTRLTTRQNQGKSASSLTVRSNDLQPESLVSGEPLRKGQSINTNNKWLKVFDSENGDIISGINKL